MNSVIKEWNYIKNEMNAPHKNITKVHRHA